MHKTYEHDRSIYERGKKTLEKKCHLNTRHKRDRTPLKSGLNNGYMLNWAFKDYIVLFKKHFVN
jgi:hypothetical protein